jgi:hypothetical protein
MNTTWREKNAIVFSPAHEILDASRRPEEFSDAQPNLLLDGKPNGGYCLRNRINQAVYRSPPGLPPVECPKRLFGMPVSSVLDLAFITA